MSSPAVSLFVVSIILLATGVAAAIMPNMVLPVMGFATTSEVWIRIMGVSIFALGYFYMVSARHELMPMLRASVYMRSVAGTAFAIMAIMGLAGPALWGFVGMEWGGAIWTAIALRGAK